MSHCSVHNNAWLRLHHLNPCYLQPMCRGHLLDRLDAKAELLVGVLYQIDVSAPVQLVPIM